MGIIDPGEIEVPVIDIWRGEGEGGAKLRLLLFVIWVSPCLLGVGNGWLFNISVSSKGWCLVLGTSIPCWYLIMPCWHLPA